jgi:hypothetical protein
MEGAEGPWWVELALTEDCGGGWWVMGVAVGGDPRIEEERGEG